MSNLDEKDQKKIDSHIAQLKSQIIEYTGKIDGVKKHAEEQKNMVELKANREVARASLNFNEFLRTVYQKSFNDYRVYETVSSRSVEKVEAKLKSEAGEDLKSNLVKLEKTLNKILENNEFLRYEAFSGSGENIRYISAGGKTEKRLPVNAEPKVKNQSWDFDGEFWADEIGHYRSSLKDNCPQSLSQNKGVN